jgi:hypothetical protein
MSAHAKQPVPTVRYHNPPLHPMEKPPAISLVELGGVAVAFLFALVAPAFVVSPTAQSATGGKIGLAAGLTILGVLVGVVVAFLAYRRTRNFSWLVIGFVPGMTLVVLAIVMAATKVGPSYGGSVG